MANIYIELNDLSVPSNHPDHFTFDSNYHSNDLAGYVREMCEKNGSKVEDIRLYVHPTFKVWSQRMRIAGKQIDWTLAGTKPVRS